MRHDKIWCMTLVLLISTITIGPAFGQLSNGKTESSNAGSDAAHIAQSSRRKLDVQRPIIGADISFVPLQEDRGTDFSDHGEQKDVLEILSDHNFNWIRLRLFVDPTAENGYSRQGHCGLEQTLAMAKRIEQAGMTYIARKSV